MTEEVYRYRSEDGYHCICLLSNGNIGIGGNGESASIYLPREEMVRLSDALKSVLERGAE